MMKKITLLIVFLLVSAANLQAASISYDSSMQYHVTLLKAEAYNSTTSTWVTLTDASLTFDIASASAGAEVGSYVSGKDVPDGTYTQVRVTVDKTFKLKACHTPAAGDVSDTATAGSTYCTNGSTVSITSGSYTHTFSAWAELAYATASLTESVVVDFRDVSASGCTSQSSGTELLCTYTFSSNLVVEPGSVAQTVDVSFDVDGILQWVDNGGGTANDYISPGTPTVTMTVR